MARPNVVKDKAFEFALTCHQLSKKLSRNGEVNVADQLFRASTSIGANIEEALGAESLKDFIHKMKIARKEAYESTYWLRLYAVIVTDLPTSEALDQIEQLKRILSSIIISSEQRLESKNGAQRRE